MQVYQHTYSCNPPNVQEPYRDIERHGTYTAGVPEHAATQLLSRRAVLSCTGMSITAYFPHVSTEPDADTKIPVDTDSKVPLSPVEEIPDDLLFPFL